MDGRRRWTRVLVGLVGAYALALIGVFVAIGTAKAPMDVVAGISMLLFSVVALVGAVGAARHQGLDRRTRRAWSFMAAGYALALCTSVVFIITGARPFPSPGDAVHLAFVLVLLFAVQQFPLHAATRKERTKHALDAAIVLAGAAMVMWYLVVGPYITAHGNSVATVAAASAYPAADLALLFGIAKVLLRGADRSTRRPLSILGIAMVIFTVGDGYLGYMQAHVDRVERTAWQFLCWLTMHFLLAVVAAEQNRQAVPDHGPVRDDPRRAVVSKLPYAAVGIGYLLMIVAAVREGHAFPWAGLVAGGVGITALVVLRQVLVQRESQEMAVTDGLTGLANRGKLHEVLARAMTRAERTGRSTAVLLVDMNGFKQINDTLGHKAGDRLLVEFGEMMRRSVLGGDLVGRLGGDEFAIVLHDIRTVDNAEAVARRIAAAAEQPIAIDGFPVRASASIGIAVAESGECNPDDLLHRADLAMYEAKRHTGNTRWTRYDASMASGTSLELELSAAVDGGQLRLMYQPIVTLADGELTGVEALVRWEHPRLGLLAPDAFIPLAERMDLIGELGRWVLEHACAQAAVWQERRPGLQLNVNVSPRQLTDEAFAGQVMEILERSGFYPGNLVLEITEHAAVTEAAPLDALSHTGIRIALDDFGTGYSSLRYLTRLPVDVLKLDRGFVAELDGTSKGSAVAQAVIRLGQVLHLDTVAEGVENEAQARELTLLGCLKAQGYHYSRPLPPEALENWLPAPSLEQYEEEIWG